MAARVYAIVVLGLVSAVMLALLTITTGATFTAPSANPSNQLATATLVAPTGVNAAVQSNGGTVRVSWTATASIWASGHRVYRATTSGGPYAQIQQIAGRTTVSYDDVPGTGTFYYIVRGYYNANGANWESADSTQASAKPLDHFSFNAIAAQHSGSAFNVTAIARSQDNAAVSAFNGTVTFTVSSGTISPTSATMTNGSLTQSVTITGPYAPSLTITTSGGTPAKSGTSGAFVLNHFRATTVALTNGAANTAGLPEAGDTIVLTFSEAANTPGLGTCPGADSASDLLTNDANPDTLTANGASLSFGTIALGSNGYFTSSKDAKRSTCAWSAGNTVLTITLVGVKSAGTVAAPSTATWTPPASLTSAAGETIDLTGIPSVTAVLF